MLLCSSVQIILWDLLALGDYIGLDIVLAIMEVIYAETGDSKYAPSPLLRKWFVQVSLVRRQALASTITVNKS